MQKRAAKEAETRQRIVDAAVALHREKGAWRTKPAEIAARANVSLATYYKYFPSLGAMVTACTARGRELIPPPDAESVAALPPDPAARIQAMVRTLFDYYEVREPWLYAGRTEEKLIPELRPAVDRLRGLREAFVRAALAPVVAGREVTGVVNALVDFWAWRTLRGEVGFTQEEATAHVADAIQRVVDALVPRHQPQ
jgi:AcrR family transcriptional regulator